MSLGDHVVGVDNKATSLSLSLQIFDGALMIEIVRWVMVCELWVCDDHVYPWS